MIWMHDGWGYIIHFRAISLNKSIGSYLVQTNFMLKQWKTTEPISISSWITTFLLLFRKQYRATHIHHDDRTHKKR